MALSSFSRLPNLYICSPFNSQAFVLFSRPCLVFKDFLKQALGFVFSFKALSCFSGIFLVFQQFVLFSRLYIFLGAFCFSKSAFFLKALSSIPRLCLLTQVFVLFSRALSCFSRFFLLFQGFVFFFKALSPFPRLCFCFILNQWPKFFLYFHNKYTFNYKLTGLD